MLTLEQVKNLRAGHTLYSCVSTQGEGKARKPLQVLVQKPAKITGGGRRWMVFVKSTRATGEFAGEEFWITHTEPAMWSTRADIADACMIEKDPAALFAIHIADELGRQVPK